MSNNSLRLRIEVLERTLYKLEALLLKSQVELAAADILTDELWRFIEERGR